MSKSSLYVLFDGPALESSEMDVRDLAPALLAFGDVIEEANAQLNGDRARMALKVKASFKAGSFGIDMEVVQSLMDQALGLFRDSPVASAKELVEYLGFTAAPVVGLLKLIKWQRGRKVQRVTEKKSERMFVIVLDDGSSLEVSPEVVTLYRNYPLRKSLEKAIAEPLQREGITTFAVTDAPERGEFVEVHEEESGWFRTPEPEDELIDEREQVVSLQLVTISFREDNKWRFSDGNSTFHARIRDEAFLHRVQTNEEAFAKGDILKVRVHIRQWLAGENMKSEYEIIEVLEHRRAGRQIPLALDNPD